MNDARLSANRLRVLALLALIAMLALGSFWLLDVMQRSLNDSLPDRARTEPDYYIDQFNFVRMSKTGQARYHVAGMRLTHNPQNDTYEIRLPVIKTLSADQPPMTIRAERALADPNSTNVQLYDNVQMDRPASGATEHFHLTSTYMQVLPDDDVMKTDRPVEIKMGNSILTGIGMLANHASREFQLAGHVRGTYQPALPR